MRAANFVIFLSVIILVGCSSSPRYGHGTTNRKDKPSTKYNRSTKKVLHGVSSFYDKDFHGKLPANGEIVDMYGLTAAHKTLPINTWIEVKNLSNVVNE